MTRWKLEPTETVVLMHAHNVWSSSADTWLQAVDELGIPNAVRRYPNSSGDGSWDTEYYCLASALHRCGGFDAVRSLADEIFLSHQDGLRG